MKKDKVWELFSKFQNLKDTYIEEKNVHLVLVLGVTSSILNTPSL